MATTDEFLAKINENLQALQTAQRTLIENNELIMSHIRNHPYLPLSGGTLTGNMMIESKVTTSNILDVTSAAVFKKVITGDTILEFTGLTGENTSCTFSLILTNGGNYAVTWPFSVKWNSSTPPVLTAGGTDVITFITNDSGHNWYGVPSSLGVG